MDACFESCGRPGCFHARWHHQSSGPCRAGPDTYECGCEGFVDPEKSVKEKMRSVGEKMAAEALAIAAEETPLEADLRERLRLAAEREEAFRVRLRALHDNARPACPAPNCRHESCRILRELRAVLEES